MEFFLVWQWNLPWKLEWNAGRSLGWKIWFCHCRHFHYFFQSQLLCLHHSLDESWNLYSLCSSTTCSSISSCLLGPLHHGCLRVHLGCLLLHLLVYVCPGKILSQPMGGGIRSRWWIHQLLHNARMLLVYIWSFSWSRFRFDLYLNQYKVSKLMFSIRLWACNLWSVQCLCYIKYFRDWLNLF